MLFNKKLLLLFAYFPFLNQKITRRSTAKVIAEVIDEDICYKSADNLDKCIMNLVTTKAYSIQPITKQTNEAKSFIKKYSILENNLKNAQFIGHIYPKKTSYQDAIIIYNPMQDVEFFIEKITFLKHLYDKGYKFKKIHVLADSQPKMYSFAELSNIKIQLKQLGSPITNDIPKHDLEIAKTFITHILKHKLNITSFYSNGSSISNIMQNWILSNPQFDAIDIQLNPNIKYFKYKWNKYTNFASRKIEVVGSAGITKQSGTINNMQNAEIILSNIGLYFYHLKQYRY